MGNEDKKAICNSIDTNKSNEYRFFFFSNDILNAKRNVAVYEGHINFRREVTKSSKFQSFQYWYLQISKIQTYHNPTKKFFKHLAHPIP